MTDPQAAETIGPVLDAITGAESTALAIIPASSLPTILAADENDILGELKRELSGFRGDATTPKGREEIRSKAFKPRRAKARLIELADKLKADAQATIRGVNSEVKALTDGLDGLSAAIRKPLDDYEAMEVVRVEAHQAALRELAALGTVPPHAASGEIQARLDELDTHILLTRDWQEFRERAQEVATAALNALKVAKMEAVAREEDAERQRVELARQQAEREAEIAREAAEAARVAAEAAAAQEAARVAQVAEEARVEAERVAQAAAEAAEAERLRLVREAEEAAGALARAERERVAAEARAESARKATHETAMEAICEAEDYGLVETAAEIKQRLHWLRNLPERDWEEYAEQAADLIAHETGRTELLLATAEEREAAATRAAEAAEAKRIAEATATAALRERNRIADEEAEAARLTAIREADKAHRAKINNEAAAAFVADGFTDKQARTIVTMIAKQVVPHVRIGY